MKTPAELDALTLSFVQERAEAIRGLARQTAENIVRIGEHLVAVKERLGHGNWLPWLEGEFGWSDETARKFMRVHDMVKSQQCWNLGARSTLALSCCSPPVDAGASSADRQQGRAAGQKVTHKLVKQQIGKVQIWPSSWLLIHQSLMSSPTRLVSFIPSRSTNGSP